MIFTLLKGQGSVEFLVIIAFLTLVAIPLILLFFTSANTAKDDVAVAQAQQTVSRIASTANEVYFAGPGNKVTLEVFIPPGVTDMRFEGKEVSFVLQTAYGRTDAVAMTLANVSTSTDWSKRLGTGTRRLVIAFVPPQNVSVDAYE